MKVKKMNASYLNFIESFSPENNIHASFIAFARQNLPTDLDKRIFDRMARKSGIVRRGSVLSCDDLDQDNKNAFYLLNNFPSTKKRMEKYNNSIDYVLSSVINKLSGKVDFLKITNIIITTCTGFSAPFIDLFLINKYKINESVERNVIGFMGCYAAINALRMADHIVRSNQNAKILIVNYELCTIHLQNSFDNLEKILSFMIFSDGCSASIVSSNKIGIRIDDFKTILFPKTEDLITWQIGDTGFDMHLSSRVPIELRTHLRNYLPLILKGAHKESIDLWAIHPGGQSILDAVEQGLDLTPDDLGPSREILAQNGNMSSATIMFVLEKMLKTRDASGLGAAMAFGPGLIAETMLFEKLD